ncbi:cold shock domain-containing protein membrane protein [Pseudomonas bharatica]|uniref:cold shock domain-containing protein membrane protein n=1 Tax=Pseudomonas bharatica TaxID=2692112 RepID=UPI003B27BE6A
MFKIVHLLTGAAALLLSFIPSLRADTTPYLQQPDAIYLALLGLANLILAPIVPQYYKGVRQYLRIAASVFLVLAVILQALALLALPDMDALAALLVALLAAVLHLGAGFMSQPKARSTGNTQYDMSNRDTGTVKWFNTSKGFGFISRDSGDDIFVHFRAIRGEGHRVLVEGQRVEFSVMNRDKGLQAEDVIAAPRR